MPVNTRLLPSQEQEPISEDYLGRCGKNGKGEAQDGETSVEAEVTV